MFRAIQILLLTQTVFAFVSTSTSRTNDSVIRHGWFDKESEDPRDKLNPAGSYGNPGRGNSKVQSAKQGRAAAQKLPVWGLAGAGVGGSSNKAVKAKIDNVASGPLVIFSAGSVSCKKAMKTFDDLGAKYTVFDLSSDPDGKSIRAELKSRTGKASMPSIWTKGQYIGSMTDGGDGGGITGLQKAGMLELVLEKSGALKGSWINNTPLAPLFGNNLRDALGNLPGQSGPMR